MTHREIEMCVLDSLLDDCEDVSQLLSILNRVGDEQSWENARGTTFLETEVQSALVRLMAEGLVTPLASQAPHFRGLQTISREAVGTTVPWSEVWFELRPEGRNTVQAWWSAEGQFKYPLR